MTSTWQQWGAAGFYRGLSPYLVFALPRGVSRFLTFETSATALRAHAVPDGCVRRVCAQPCMRGCECACECACECE